MQSKPHVDVIYRLLERPGHGGIHFDVSIYFGGDKAQPFM